MRNPSLHITRSELIRILEEVIGTNQSKEIIADKILKKARKKAPIHRGITVNSDRMEKKAKKMVMANMSDAELFSHLLLHKRRSMKHRGLTQIKAGSREWSVLKEVTLLANEFCETHNLEKREGYIEFMNIGIERMAKFMLVKFLNMANSIIEIYSFIKELQEDEHPQKTEKLYHFYQNQILSKTGMSVDYKKPEKYIYFYRARLQANELKISGVDYIKAQFHALEWRSGYPDPAQLTNSKALQNVTKYLYEKGINIRQKESTIDWAAIKRLGNDQD